MITTAIIARNYQNAYVHARELGLRRDEVLVVTEADNIRGRDLSRLRVLVCATFYGSRNWYEVMSYIHSRDWSFEYAC